jgi:hypothetical protein
VAHDDTAATVASGIDAAERRVRAAVPIAKIIYLEPDLERPVVVPPVAASPAGDAGNTPDSDVKP